MTATIFRAPCKSCPYRQDVPSGIWEKEEYDKILPYDNPTMFQPPTMFMCHQQDGSVCRGWLDCHGDQLLGLRLACARGDIAPEDVSRAFEEGPAVPVFKTADLASRHGRKAIEKPSKKAKTLINQIEKKRGKK